MDSLKMESPVKKLDFATGKENAPFDADLDTLASQIESQKPAVEQSKEVSPKNAEFASIKALEAEEPLLQENPQRFVLFPIKYHEVSPKRRVRRVKWILNAT